MRKGPSVLNARREKIILLQLVLTQMVTHLWTDDATTMSCALSVPGICQTCFKLNESHVLRWLLCNMLKVQEEITLLRRSRKPRVRFKHKVRFGEYINSVQFKSFYCLSTYLLRTHTGTTSHFIVTIPQRDNLIIIKII